MIEKVKMQRIANRLTSEKHCTFPLVCLKTPLRQASFGLRGRETARFDRLGPRIRFLWVPLESGRVLTGALLRRRPSIPFLAPERARFRLFLDPGSQL